VRTRDGVAHYTNIAENILVMLRRHVDATPDLEAVAVLGGERLTYRKLWDRAARVAGGLRAEGITRGQRVASRLPNGLPWVVAFFGTLMAGAALVPVNTRFTEPEAEYVIADSGSTFVFRPNDLLPDGPPFSGDGGARSDMAAIFYTSGTTGFPKGAMLSHEACLSAAETTSRVLDLPYPGGERFRSLIVLPLFHVSAFSSQLLGALSVGGSVVIMPTVNVAALLAAIPGERINGTTLVPALCSLVLKHPSFAHTDVGGMFRLGYGGAPIAPTLVRRIKAAFPAARVFNGFGMSETAGATTILPHELATDHADSVGFPSPINDLALEHVDPDTGTGELLIRGANVMLGYWNKEEATRDALLEGVWMRTGDVARIGPSGLTYIVDRVKDVINRGGENVYSVEIENALAGVPCLAESAIVGVPDDVMGEKVGMVLVQLPNETVDVPAIIASLSEKLADFKIPQYAVVRDKPLPRNPGGKILKAALRHETSWGKPLR